MIFNWENLIPKISVNFITNKLSRRQILKGLFSSSAFLGLTAAGPIKSSLANAPKPFVFKDEDRTFLIQIAKDIYPHDDFLDDEPYIEVVDGILKETSTDEVLRSTLLVGLSALNKDSKATHGQPYVKISSYGAREAMLRRIEEGAFFQKIRGGLLFGLYNNVKLFPKFGYEGSSWEQGGYIDRGFSDMTWLPQDPRVKGDKK